MLLMGASGLWPSMPLCTRTSILIHSKTLRQSVSSGDPTGPSCFQKSGLASLSDLTARLKDASTKNFYGSAGAGTPQHLAAELFLQKTKLTSTHGLQGRRTGRVGRAGVGGSLRL
jgi:hypothetical protein